MHSTPITVLTRTIVLFAICLFVHAKWPGYGIKLFYFFINIAIKNFLCDTMNWNRGIPNKISIFFRFEGVVGGLRSTYTQKAKQKTQKSCSYCELAIDLWPIKNKPISVLQSKYKIWIGWRNSVWLRNQCGQFVGKQLICLVTSITPIIWKPLKAVIAQIFF